MGSSPETVKTKVAVVASFAGPGFGSRRFGAACRRCARVGVNLFFRQGCEGILDLTHSRSDSGTIMWSRLVIFRRERHGFAFHLRSIGTNREVSRTFPRLPAVVPEWNVRSPFYSGRVPTSAIVEVGQLWETATRVVGRPVLGRPGSLRWADIPGVTVQFPMPRQRIQCPTINGTPGCWFASRSPSACDVEG